MTTYQGWTDRETWVVHLWLTNDSAIGDTARQIAKGPASAREAAEALQSYVTSDYDLMDGRSSGMAHDLIAASLARVNWKELVETYRAED